MNRRFLVALTGLVTLAILLAPALVLGHPGHDHGHLSVWQGLLHPITGIDHLLAALVIGAWAMLQKEQRWLLPAGFLAAMVVGAGAVAAGLTIPFVHGLSALSLVALGACLIAAHSMHRHAALGLVALTGLVHGAAHVTGISAGFASAALYVAALVLATAALHAAGFGAARLAFTARLTSAPRFAGAAVALTGALMLGWHLI